MNKITPFLWFDHQAKEAVDFYVSIFPNAKIIDESSNSDDIQSISFELFNQRFIAFNGGPYASFSPAISMYVDCENQEEVDSYWDRLAVGGKIEQCGWLSDKYGLTWQIIPNILFDCLNHPDPIKAQKAMDAMLKMTKINVNELLDTIK